MMNVHKRQMAKLFTNGKCRLAMAVLAMAAMALPSVAAVGIGENLLVNGRLEADQVDFPQGWSFFPTRMIRPE